MGTHQSQRTLSRTSTVSPTLISTLEAGTAALPHPSVLRKLATGLATDGQGNVDERRGEEHYLALMRAAGYLPPEDRSSEDRDAALRAQIAAVVGPDRAEMAEALLRKLRQVDDRDQETILRVLDTLLDTLPRHSIR
jgi:transcriptional regulator with XRE-family HTH domain